MIDTTGGWSWLAVVVVARGAAAETLRQELESEGLDAMARKRLAECAARYVTVRTDGPPDFRDDPATNEFAMAEIFEIKDFLRVDSGPKWRKLELPIDYIANFLRMPGPGPRRAPFALPHPCHLVHSVELHSVALAPALVQQRSVKTKFMEFTRVRKTLAGFWTMKLSLSTLADSVPPEALEEHRTALEEIRKQSTWSILLPAGEARPQRRGDFGMLPAPPTPVPVPTAPVPVALPPEAAAPPETPAEDQLETPPSTSAELRPGRGRRGRKRRRKLENAPKSKWPVFAACVLGLTLIVIVIVVAKNADHWNIFRRRPPPPATDLTPNPP